MVANKTKKESREGNEGEEKQKRDQREEKIIEREKISKRRKPSN